MDDQGELDDLCVYFPGGAKAQYKTAEILAAGVQAQGVPVATVRARTGGVLHYIGLPISFIRTERMISIVDPTQVPPPRPRAA